MAIEFYSIPKAASLCNVSRTTMWRWVKQGMLTAYTSPGGIYQIKEHDLKTFVQDKMKHLSSHLFLEKRILIVDDDPKMIQLLTRMLSSSRYRLESAVNGFEAGQKIYMLKPDLIILDLHMPMVDVFDLCNQLKQNPNTEYIKVIAITGFDTPENRVRIMRAGADDYLAKPIEQSVILKRIAALLKN